MITLFESFVLGIVEGITEFLPVSSTGHLILASAWLGLQGEAVKSFEVVIQAGALAAIVLLYWQRIVKSLTGDADSRRLLLLLAVSFLPAAIAGLVFHKVIKEHLFGVVPVAVALAVGGIVMLIVERKRRRSRPRLTIDAMSIVDALVIGLAQCLALWPGTSRSMTTIVSGMLLGLSAKEAAEYSFLLAIPTLGAATLFELVSGGTSFMQQVGTAQLACGFLTSAVVALVSVRAFVNYLTARGLAPFAWYRIIFGISLAVWL
jgi:undecaprenyl-diphosphatase